MSLLSLNSNAPIFLYVQKIKKLIKLIKFSRVHPSPEQSPFYPHHPNQEDL